MKWNGMRNEEGNDKLSEAREGRKGQKRKHLNFRLCIFPQESRIRLEQQVKDQEAMLKLFREQQKQQQQTQVTPQLQPAIQPQGTYVSYVPVQAMPGVQAIPGVQGIQATPPIYTIPQVYGTVPPTLGFQHK